MHPKFDPQELKLFFGWNAFNTNIATFVEANPQVAFITPQREAIWRDVVASYGADFPRLGQEAADLLLENFFVKQSSLGKLSIRLGNKTKPQVNMRRLQRFNLELGTDCTWEKTG